MEEIEKAMLRLEAIRMVKDWYAGLQTAHNWTDVVDLADATTSWLITGQKPKVAE